MSSEINRDDVRHMAELARLELSEEDQTLFKEQFSKILGHMDILEELDTSGLEPLYSPIAASSHLRTDKIQKKLVRAEVLANAPETDGEFFIVPRII